MKMLQEQVNELVKAHGYDPVRDAMNKVLRREALIAAYKNIQRRGGVTQPSEGGDQTV